MMAEERTYELFISYAEADRAWVEGYLLDALEKAEVRYTSESAFTLGMPRISEFERAIRQSQATLLVISEAYLADDLTQFTDILAQSYGEQVGNWPVIPLTLQEGLQLPSRLKMLEGLKARSLEEREDAIERLCHQLKHPLPPPTPKPACPYPGMIPFSENDEGSFFGRDNEIEELLGILRLNPFFTVIGPSGSGKSSLVFAGLIPKLKQSGLFGAGQWCIRSLRPGTSPLANLQALLKGDVTALEARIQQLLSTQPDARRLLLVVDQFEELFTQGGKEGTSFQQALLTLSEIPNVYLILTVRADFYPDLMGSLLWKKIRSHRFEVLPLDEKGLQQAIVRPAEGVEVYIESALVERLLGDAKGEPGILPLIQETLVLLWEKLERHYLPLKAYELMVLPRSAYGATETQPKTGLQVAIALRADAALADLETEEKQAIARRIFLRLIQFGEGRPDTRRQQLEADLRSFEENSQLFDETLQHLAYQTRRLLTLSGEEGGQNRKVDIAHEALISGWPKLQQWISELREAEQTRRRLARKAQEWIRLEKKGGLLDEAELPEAESWLSGNEAQVLGYDKSLYDLITTSREVIEEVKRQKEEQEQQKLKLIEENLKAEKLAKQKAQTLNWVAGIFSICLTGATIFASYQWRKAEIGEIRAFSSTSKALLLSNNYFDALIASLKASRKLNGILVRLPIPGFEDKADTQRQVDSLLQETVYKVRERNRLENHEDEVVDVKFSPNGQRIASGSGDGTVILWSRDGREITTLTGHQTLIHGISFSPDSQTIATASWEGTVKLWSKDGKLLQTIEEKEHKEAFYDVSFSPDGQTIATGSEDKTVILWKKDAKDGKFSFFKRLKGHTEVVNSVAFSPDGQRIASGSGDGTVILWSRDGEKLNSITVLPNNDGDYDDGDNGVWSLSFSSTNSQTIAIGSKNRTVQIWSLDKDQPKILSHHSDPVTSVSFSPDGQTIASASSDNSIQLWSLEGDKLQTLTGHKDWIWSVSFSPDGETIASASKDTTVKLWQVKGKNLSVIPAHEAAIYSVCFSPDGETIASASKDKTVKLWSKDGKLLQTLKDKDYESGVTDLSFSRDGEIIVTATEDKMVKLWNKKGKLLQTIDAHKGWVWSVCFSPDGQTIASASGDDNDHTVKLWNWDNINQKFKFFKTLNEHKDRVNSVSFSPDSKTIATASWDKTVILWNRNGEKLQTLEKHKDGVHSVRFSPDGKTIATASEDKTIKLWRKDAKERKFQFSKSLNDHEAGVFSVSFSSDGERIASGSLDGTVKLWSQDGQQIKTFTGHNNKVFSVDFSTDDKTLASSDKAGKLILWDLELDSDDLMQEGCDWLHDYLKNNPKVSEGDRHLCK